MSRRIIRFVSAATVSAIALYPACVQAQTADEGAAAEEVVVTGLRASLRDALQAKRANPVVTETISAKDIGALPNVTIAEELSRLPGVNTTRDRGNASQAAVRGLGPRLVLGLVNGREVASSEPDRNVRWEIYPAEIVSSATIYKSQGADLIAGGVAATIDIRTLRPLDYSGPSLVGRAGAIYNDGGRDIPDYTGWGQRGSLQYVGKLSDTLGFVAGGTYQRQKNGFSSFQGWGYNTADTGNPPTTAGGAQINAPWGAQTEAKGLTETRWSATGAIQWKPNADWDVNLDLLYSKVKIDEQQSQQWFGRSNGWGEWGGSVGTASSIYRPGNYTLVGNTIVAATLNNFSSVTNVLAQYDEDKDLFVTGLNAKYSDGVTTAKFDISYSRAKRNNQWAAIATESYPSSTSFSTAAGVVPSVSVSTNPADPASQVVQSYFPGLYNGPDNLADELAAAQADFYRNFETGFFKGAGVGLRYASRVKSFSASTASVATRTGGGLSIPSSALTSFAVSDFSAPNLLWGDYNSLAASLLTIGTPTADSSRYWRVKEDNFEGYFVADFESGILSGNVGVRLVNVSTHSDAFSAVTSWNGSANVTTITPVRENNDYFRALPSLNMNFDLTSELKLRAGVARVIARPPLDELRANQTLSFYPPFQEGSAGNPQLEPFMATQGDLSLEWYFHKDALFAVSAYYKDVDTNIGYAQTPRVIGGNTYLITGPANGAGGYIAGVETTFQTPFYFIPGLENFGVYANAAFVDSNIEELAPASNPLAAVGLAEFTGQADLWYSAHGLDARVSVKYHSPYTVIYGWDASSLTRLEAETTIGASISYAINQNIAVRLQANNLTNQAARFYWNNDPNQIARYEKYGRNYLADITFKF